uniref:Zinc finger, MYND-type containing 8 n=1 Tax=Amphiprion ocellaris TaxID=80972 RepID=A0A3Q1C634_AMPOC
MLFSCVSVAEEEVRTEKQAVTEEMEISTRSKVSDTGSTERMAQKRKMPSPSHSSNGHSSAETSPCPMKKKKKPGAVSSSKDQSELRHGPFYYVKQPALTTDPVDVVPQDGRNDFYCWLCHREGQVLCCELCPRVYHAKCLKLPAEPEGDWFCPECEKITVAECIETQSKAMMMLTIDQLSYLLKFALQKMKQPGTEPFQKPVSLEQHPDYAEYIFHPMDLCTLEKNIKKKMYGCTEAFLADAKWILHNCIIYNGGNHKLTATAKVIVKICEHEMNEIEVCPECYLSACQKRDNWFCEPCSNPHPLVWAKLKGFPFWPAKALRDKDGQVDARFFGQHDRAWVPLNNCYLMSKEIPFSVKKTKSIFNSAMQEMEVYVENMRKKFGVFNYAPFRTPYTPDNNFQMLLDPSNPSSTPVKPEKQEKIKLSFDMTASPKIPLTRAILPGAGVGGSTTGRRLPLSDMPRSPMSTNSSAHTGSDGEQETGDKSQTKAANSQYSTGEESMDLFLSTASPAHSRPGPAGSSLDSPKPFHSQAPGIPKQEKTPQTGSILNLNLDRSKADMDLKELSETVQQKQGAPPVLTSPKRQIKSRFQLNLDKTIESCKAQLGIDEISVDAYKGVEHSDSEDSDKSESSDSEYASDEEQKTKDGQDTAPTEEPQKEPSKPKVKDQPSPSLEGESKADVLVASESAAGDTSVTVSDAPTKEKMNTDLEKESSEKSKAAAESPVLRDKVKQETKQTVPVEDSDSERELVIDLGEEQGGKDRKRSRKDNSTIKESTAGKASNTSTLPSQNSTAPSTPSSVSTQSPMAIPVTMVSFTAPSPATISLTSVSSATATPPSSSSASTTPALKKQRPLLPRETVPVVQRAVVWNPTAKFQTSSQKWHMQKVQRQQQNQQPVAMSSSSSQQSSQSTRYQTRQSVKAVQLKDSPLSTSTSAVTLVSSSPASVAMMAASSLGTAATSSPVATDLYIPTASADVAADIAKYTNKIMDAIKGTMTEIYNDLSKSTSGNTIAEIRRLRIEIEKLQWLHQQELSEMKHNLELTMAEMRQSLEQERERLVTEVKKQTELEKQQAVDETKKKQWCANCRKEAIFYCCWNTSYCDYPCQQAHCPFLAFIIVIHITADDFIDVKFFCFYFFQFVATAPQQEPEAEPTADPPNKSLGQTNSGPNSIRDSPASAPPDKDCDVEKSTDNVAVTLPCLWTTSVVD